MTNSKYKIGDEIGNGYFTGVVQEVIKKNNTYVVYNEYLNIYKCVSEKELEELK